MGYRNWLEDGKKIKYKICRACGKKFLFENCCKCQVRDKSGCVCSKCFYDEYSREADCGKALKVKQTFVFR